MHDKDVMQIDSFAISHVGHIRSNNEDVWKILPEHNLFLIADGMGGHNAGEVAAAITAESMCASFEDHTPDDSVEETCHKLREAVTFANQTVYQAAKEFPQYAGMGTTLSCFVIQEGALIYAHVGDTRLYRYRRRLEQLTEDHSLRTLKEGFGPRHVITRAIGSQYIVQPDIGVIALQPGDLYLLCSDGLSDLVAKSTLESMLAAPRALEEIGTALVQTALEKGGNDNITLLLVKVQ
ncbi:MAG: serine/threonine-protein phosphatase [Verrucomicrobia bacterium]|nr:serine/threonine-protein phosphatase [Verrucomicrobiota bacterium]